MVQYFTEAMIRKVFAARGTELPEGHARPGGHRGVAGNRRLRWHGIWLPPFPTGIND